METLGFSFGKERRILSRLDFARILDKGSKRVSARFSLICVPRANGPMRLGLIVSKKLGKAHERNLVKRRLREAFRQLPPALSQCCFDCVVIARVAAKTALPLDFIRDFERILPKFESSKESSTSK